MPLSKPFRTALCLAVLAAAALPCRAEVVEQIVAQVNGDIISLTDYTREKNSLYQMLRAQYSGAELTQHYAQMTKEILPGMINEMLLIDKAKEYGFTTDLDLEARQVVEDMMKRERIPNMEVLKQEMAKQGLSYNQYFDSLKKQLLSNRIKGAIVRQRVKILRDDIEKYYQEHKAEYTVPEKVELEEIVIYSKDKIKDVMRAKAAEADARLKAGDAFGEVAKQYSEGPTAAQGGKIGSFSVSTLSRTISNAINNVPAGKFVGPIEADYGLVFVNVAARSTAQAKPFEEVKNEIEDQLYRTKVGPVLETYVKELRQESYIYVAPEFRSDYDPDADPAYQTQSKPEVKSEGKPEAKSESKAKKEKDEPTK